MATETIDINGVHHILFTAAPSANDNEPAVEALCLQIYDALYEILPLSEKPGNTKVVSFSDDPLCKFYTLRYYYSSNTYWLKVRFDCYNDQNPLKRISSTDLDVPLTRNFHNDIGHYTSQSVFYLNYVKSKTGKTIAFGFSFETPSNEMWYLCAMDENNRRGVFSLIGTKLYVNNSTDWRLYTFNGFASPSGNSSYFNYTLYHLNYISTDQSSTSLVQVPNPWGGAMFKDLYVITSTPLDTIEGIQNGTFLMENGRKFKGIYGGVANLRTKYSVNYNNTLPNLVGPFAIEIE